MEGCVPRCVRGVRSVHDTDNMSPPIFAKTPQRFLPVLLGAYTLHTNAFQVIPSKSMHRNMHHHTHPSVGTRRVISLEQSPGVINVFLLLPNSGQNTCESRCVCSTPTNSCAKCKIPHPCVRVLKFVFDQTPCTSIRNCSWGWYKSRRIHLAGVCCPIDVARTF